MITMIIFLDQKSFCVVSLVGFKLITLPGVLITYFVCINEAIVAILTLLIILCDTYSNYLKRNLKFKII